MDAKTRDEEAQKSTISKIGPALNKGIASVFKTALAEPEVIKKEKPKQKEEAAPPPKPTVGKMTEREKAAQAERSKPKEKETKKKTYYGD